MIASSSSTGVPRVLVSTHAADRGELLLHALAQLPDTVGGELVGDGEERARLELLARAYGLEGRLGPTEGGAAARVTTGGMTMAELVASLAPDGGGASTRRGDDSVLEGERVAVVTNLPVHYRLPLFAGMARRLADAGADLHVFFGAGHDSRRHWIVPDEEREFEHFVLAGPASLERALERSRPTLVLAGGFGPRALRAAAWAAARRVAFGIWSGETPAMAAGYRRGRTPLRRGLLSRAGFAVVYGSLAGAYLRGLAPRLPFVIGRNSSPVPPLASRDGEGPVEVLTVARVLPGKGLELLVDAFAMLADLECRLTVVGGGAGLEALRARARNVPGVRIAGPLPPHEVRALYAASDAFAFPSRMDVFGLVLLEAMGAGLAVAADATVGALADLVVPGRSGVIVERPAPDAWEATLRELVADASKRTSLGTAAARTVRDRWTIEHAVDAMTAGLRLGVLTRAR